MQKNHFLLVRKCKKSFFITDKNSKTPQVPSSGPLRHRKYLARPPQGDARDAHEHGVHDPRGDGHGLEGVERLRAAGDEEGGGGQPLQEGPEQPLHPRRVGVAVGGEALDHEGAGVAGGDEVEDERDEGKDGEERPEVVVAHHDVEPHLLDVAAGEAGEATVLGRLAPVVPPDGVDPGEELAVRQALADDRLQEADGAGGAGVGAEVVADEDPGVGRLGRHVDDGPDVDVVAAAAGAGRLALDPEAGPAEDGAPEKDEDDGGGHGAVDELLDGPAPGDLCDEHADKGAPGDPPAPVEDGPAVHPAGRAVGRVEAVGHVPAPVPGPVARAELLEGVAVKAELDDVLKVVAEGLDVEVEQVGGVAEKEGEQHHHEAEAEADLAQPSDAVLDAGEDGPGGDGRDAPDDGHLALGPDGDVGVDDAEALVDLYRAQAEAGADSEEGGDDGEGVDEVAGPAEDVVPDEGVEAGLHGEGEALAVGHDAEEDADEGVDDPAVEAPVVQGDVHGLLGQLVVGHGGVFAVPVGACKYILL